MLDKTVEHLVQNVLPAGEDYFAAEKELTRAYDDSDLSLGESEALLAKRRAAEFAIAIDGLTDRCVSELGYTRSSIRNEISALCFWPGGDSLRAGVHDRVRGVANAYKHQDLADADLPIGSIDDVLVVGLGYGLDVYRVGKMGSVEVLVREKSGKQFKFLGDTPTSVAAWFGFLRTKGAPLPVGPCSCCGVKVYG